MSHQYIDPDYERRIQVNNNPNLPSYPPLDGNRTYPPQPYPYNNTPPYPYLPQQQQQQQQQQPYPYSTALPQHSPPQQLPYSRPYQQAPPLPQQQQLVPPPAQHATYTPQAPPQYAQRLPPGPPSQTATVMASPFRPTGRKRALLVGINYKGTRAALRGCVRDVTYVHHLLTSKFGFRSKDCVVLTDESTGISGVRKGNPTRRTIIDSLKWLVNESRPGDSLWFSFSGHGSQVRDSNGDESDGWDETILPVDYKSAGHIVDDDLYKIVKRVHRGARLTVLLDACHSGTGLDLPYQHDVFGAGSGQKISTGRPQSLTSGLFTLAGQVLSGSGSGALQAGLNLAGIGRKKKKPLPGPNPNEGEVLLFSGCKDNQTSADTSQLTGGLVTGAMTYALIETIEHSSVGDWRNYTYRKLLQTMRQKLRAAKMTQTPQFSTSHPFDLSSPFIL